MVRQNATNTYSNSRYVVYNVRAGCFTTIQAAINAAVADGGASAEWIVESNIGNLTVT